MSEVSKEQAKLARQHNAWVLFPEIARRRDKILARLLECSAATYHVRYPDIIFASGTPLTAEKQIGTVVAVLSEDNTRLLHEQITKAGSLLDTIRRLYNGHYTHLAIEGEGPLFYVIQTVVHWVMIDDKVKYFRKITEYCRQNPPCTMGRDEIAKWMPGMLRYGEPLYIGVVDIFESGWTVLQNEDLILRKLFPPATYRICIHGALFKDNAESSVCQIQGGLADILSFLTKNIIANKSRWGLLLVFRN